MEFLSICNIQHCAYTHAFSKVKDKWRVTFDSTIDADLLQYNDTELLDSPGISANVSRLMSRFSVFYPEYEQINIIGESYLL